VSEFRGIVGPIVLLAEPLSASSLSHLLGMSTITLARTFYRLHAVLDIPSSADVPIRSFHLSFRDFLIDPAKRDRNEFWIDQREVHHKVATNCLRLMESSLKKDICGLKIPGKPRLEVSSETIDICLPAYIQYACRHWIYHFAQSKERIGDGDQVHMFLECHFLHWLEALSLIGKISESIGMIDTLYRRVKVCIFPRIPVLGDLY
jgi:hypothetical protein